MADGQDEEQSAPTPAVAVAEAEAEPIRGLDFSQPTKFNTELRRRIARVLDPFCESLSSWMSGELRAEVEVRVADTAQLTWAQARAELSAESIAVAVEAAAIERQMLLNVELTTVLAALECLLGGVAADAPTERHMTEIDWVLTRGVLNAIVRQLSQAWDDLGGPPLTRGEVDMEGDAGVLVSVGEPTLAITFEIAIDGLESKLSLLLPWIAIEPITERIRGADGELGGSDSHGVAALRRGLVRAPILLRVEVGSVQMPIERMLALGQGSVLALDDDAEDGVLLFAEGVSLGRARPGRSGPRRAIKLLSTGEPPIRADTYAKLGRPELERARANLDEAAAGDAASGEREILHSIFVRVWAELGRTHMALGQALELTPGAVVELDQHAEAPIELFANGLCFADGGLVVTGDGAWGVQVARLLH